ncbi:hypothetical protein PCYB_005150, partial [Plasmodium cynomolgi strain B]
KIILDGLPEYKLYDNFNSTISTDEYSYYCDVMKSFNNEYSGCFPLCQKFSKNLIELSKIRPGTMSDIERCRYFNLWLFHEVSEKFPNYDKNIYLPPIIIGFFSSWSLINETPTLKDKCYFTYINSITLSTWKKWKDVHDFFRNYDSLKKIFPLIKINVPYILNTLVILKKYMENIPRNAAVQTQESVLKI